MPAGKVTVSIGLRWVLENSSIQGNATEVTTQVGRAAIENVQFIGTASEELDFGDVTDAGWILLKNFFIPTDNDAGPTIYISKTDPAVADETSIIQLKGGKSAYMPPAEGGGSYFAISDRADSQLLVIAIQR